MLRRPGNMRLGQTLVALLWVIPIASMLLWISSCDNDDSVTAEFVAVDEIVTTARGLSITVAVVENETDANGRTLIVTRITQGMHGTVVLNANNTVTYTPDTDFDGADYFTYQLTDEQGGRGTGTVTIRVLPADGIVLHGRLYTINDMANPDLSAPFFHVGINNSGQIIGLAPDLDSSIASYFIDNGQVTYTGCSHETIAVDINDSGQFVGNCLGAGVFSTPDFGFFHNNNGLHFIEFLNAIATRLSNINDMGQIVGSALLADVSLDSVYFVLQDDIFNTIEVPGEPAAINNIGQIAGGFIGDDGAGRGYLWDHGVVTVIDIPGAVRVFVSDMNNKGQIAGSFHDVDDVSYGWFWDKESITVIKVLDAASTSVADVNDAGQIVGESRDADDVRSGFLWDAGQIATIRIPNASSAWATDINNHGQIVGGFSRDETYGFVATPVDSGPFTSFETLQDQP